MKTMNRWLLENSTLFRSTSANSEIHHGLSWSNTRGLRYADRV